MIRYRLSLAMLAQMARAELERRALERAKDPSNSHAVNPTMGGVVLQANEVNPSQKEV